MKYILFDRTLLFIRAIIRQKTAIHSVVPCIMCIINSWIYAYVHAGECAKQLFPQHCDCQMWALYNGALYGSQSFPPAGTHCSRQPGA